MYGHCMSVDLIDRKTGQPIKIILGPFEPGDEIDMARGMCSKLVTAHLNSRGAPTAAMEIDWLTKHATSDDGFHWCIRLVEGQQQRAIGITSINLGDSRPPRIGESGFVIYDRTQWGRGIASAAHLARLQYGFNDLGLTAVTSGADQTNPGSLRALASVGYVKTGTEYFRGVVAGCVTHVTRLIVVNPAEHVWNYAWGDTKIPKKFHIARQVTLDALGRAATQVTYL